MKLTYKLEGRNGVHRQYQHQKHGKVKVVTLWDEPGAHVIYVGHEQGWEFVGNPDSRRERQMDELLKLTKPKRTRRKAAADPAKRRQA